MPSSLLRAESPKRLGLDAVWVEHLVTTLRRFVEEAMLPSGQLALARHGKLGALASFGEVVAGGERRPASDQTLYCAFSTTKAVTSSAVWLLIQDGKLGVGDRVAEHVPEFASNGKADVTVEHLLTHTAGFPSAPFDALDWADRERRLARFASWRLEWPPGERFQYHGASGMWVLAELIERVAAQDFRDFVRTRVVRPLGLPDLHLGLGAELDSRVAELVQIGDDPPPGALEGSGLAIPEQFVSDAENLLRFNRPEVRAVGVPGGGGIMNAASLALFYQALLNEGRGADGTPVWQPEVLREALRIRTGALTDPMTGRRANRSLGLVIAGDEERVFRSFAPNNSAESFGHAGAGGQVAWADPATGISFAFLTNGCDRNPLAMGARGIALSRAAAACAQRA
jgi:CubicO group peptidase (beta-lactamase class C family)